MKPLFSVVIPTFNNAEFLRKAINSVLNQTYTNFEVIIIDNHSTDHTSELIKGFNDSRLNFYQIKNYGVIALSRNRGVELSSGEWVAFLDSDDYWYPSKLESFSRNLDNNSKYDVLSSNEYKFNSITGRKSKLMYGPIIGSKYRCLLLYGNRLSTSATAVRKEFLIKHNIKFNEQKKLITVEDYDYWLQLALADASFKFIPKFEGEYLVHGDNSSGNLALHKSNELNLMRDHVFKIQGFDRRKERLWRKVNSRMKFHGSLVEIRRLNISRGLKSMFISFSENPLFLSSYVLFLIYIKTLNFLSSIIRN